MTEYDLHFSPSSSRDAGSFKLLELPSDLCKLIEDAMESMTPLRFKIKGKADENAVLCTANKTFAIRSVALSNSVLVVTPPPDTSSLDFTADAVVIRDQVSEILELTPSVPKLHTTLASLRGREYDDGQEDDGMNESPDDMKKITYDDALRTIQASDIEIDLGLKSRHILIINGELRPISRPYLDRLLELILNVLIALSLPHNSAPVEALSSSLADEHDVPRTVSTQVMSWFGTMQHGKWKMDVNALIKEVGLGVLRHHRHDPINRDDLVAKWKSLVGDAFESRVDLGLLSGSYLASTSDPESLTYFPTSLLPIDPAARFADLFLTRSRWKAKDITPFLADIAVDSKERDKLLLKFARATTDADGVWYTARAQYNG
ncbi:putative sister chromatid cohesion protein Dcc1 [Lyophyllum shimeji]|uniref:Sister chromatid cohesion protein Dcc1 n=1 Tax=Lyophyllum shimeji TaxID=47721 RepID=A0A9P3PEC2_LYOSH|nr:putative sister chromatid cohesion protein Dcc1 [Lyophyllum shimeji]